MSRSLVWLSTFAVMALSACEGSPGGQNTGPRGGGGGGGGKPAVTAGRSGNAGGAGRGGAAGIAAVAGAGGTAAIGSGSAPADAAAPDVAPAGTDVQSPLPDAGGGDAAPAVADKRRHMILDTDANNEIDDQHAIAYMLFNADTWIVDGITTNRTQNGGGIANHTKEARFVVALCASDRAVKVYQGADKNYNDIKGNINQASFDGSEAVSFIIEQARKRTPTDKLLLVPVGKMTNVALALLKDPTIADKIHITWLGSNYPDDGEYNLEQDNDAVNAVISSSAELDIALVRYAMSNPGGTWDVGSNPDEIRANIKGAGPKVPPIKSELHGGGSYTNFGDYSVNLFNGPRPLFDMAALAIIKNPKWAAVDTVGAPTVRNNSWQKRPDNPRKVRFFRDFKSEPIIADFFKSVKEPKLAQ